MSWSSEAVGCEYMMHYCDLIASITQEGYDDDDEWNPCKAAGVCLMLMATCCEDDIVQHVLPFVKDNIKHQDWRHRDAAVMAFGKQCQNSAMFDLSMV